MKTHRLLLCLLSAAGILRAADDEVPSLFRNPTLSRTHIVFEHGGDLWNVPRRPDRIRPTPCGAEQVTLARPALRHPGWKVHM